MADRAAVVAATVLQIVTRAFRAGGGETDLAAARTEITTLLRDELANIARMTRDEIRPSDT